MQAQLSYRWAERVAFCPQGPPSKRQLFWRGQAWRLVPICPESHCQEREPLTVPWPLSLTPEGLLPGEPGLGNTEGKALQGRLTFLLPSAGEAAKPSRAWLFPARSPVNLQQYQPQWLLHHSWCLWSLTCLLMLLGLQPGLLSVILGGQPQTPRPKSPQSFLFPSKLIPTPIVLWAILALIPGSHYFPFLLFSSWYLNIKSSLWALCSSTKSASTAVVGSPRLPDGNYPDFAPE